MMVKELQYAVERRRWPAAPPPPAHRQPTSVCIQGGMRISSQAAYMAGSVCTIMQLQDPSILGMYLIDRHPACAAHFVCCCTAEVGASLPRV